MGSSGEKSAKKAKKEKKDTPKSSKKRDRDGLPVPSSASKGGEGDDDEKQNPVCAIASPLADGKLTKKLLKVVKKGKQMNKSGVVISEEEEERHPRRFVSLVLLLSQLIQRTFVLVIRRYERARGKRAAKLSRLDERFRRVRRHRVNT